MSVLVAITHTLIIIRLTTSIIITITESYSKYKNRGGLKIEERKAWRRIEENGRRWMQ